MIERENSHEQILVAIEKLIHLEFLTNQDKASIVLVSQGLKPVALVEMHYQENTPGYSKEEFGQNIDHFKQTLQELRLSFQSKAVSVDSNSYESFYIGRTQEVIERLINATELVDIRKKDKAMGKSLGIPDTAIEAFINNQTVKLSELPEEAAKEFRLTNFLPSKDHWQEELKYVKAQNEAIAKLAPQLLSK